MSQKTAIIIGAGPAGLTAAYELLDKTDVKPVILELSEDLGGIAKTVNYKGNHIDIGPHRFFSKSDRVVRWWHNILPLQGAPARDDLILEREVPLSRGATRREIGEEETKIIKPPDPEKQDAVMLYRSRMTRILYLRKFFDYPISINMSAIVNLGPIRLTRIMLSYLKVKIFPVKKEKSLEDFMINRFGRELFLTFFKDYTEKVWGVSCDKIKPEWGAQRIKGLSITKALMHAARSMIKKDKSIGQKKTETSLIGQFQYPKFGPGQMWEETARIVKSKGGEIHLSHKVVGVKVENSVITEVTAVNASNEGVVFKGDYVFSSMAIKHLIRAFDKQAPEEARDTAEGLLYRDFITVGILCNKLKIKNKTKQKSINDVIPDNWIYIQESDVRVARMTIFNNFSPYMVQDPNKVWLGLEYLCNIGDDLWSKGDDEFKEFAISELIKVGLVDPEDVLDHILIRMPKAYPAYFGAYDDFDKIRAFTDGIENLFLVGRNGMHRYNNQDHSMMTAMVAVENIINNIKTKDNIWSVNVEQDYHEEKKETDKSS